MPCQLAPGRTHKPPHRVVQVLAPGLGFLVATTEDQHIVSYILLFMVWKGSYVLRTSQSYVSYSYHTRSLFESYTYHAELGTGPPGPPTP